MKDIRICVGSSCFLKGSHQVMDAFAALLREHALGDQVTLAGAFCLEQCRDGVAVSIDGVTHSVPNADAARALFESLWETETPGGSDAKANDRTEG
jgi:NADH:ubiquinone oxidoreductase subunit E